jgi:four helix bundle protein
VESGTESRHRRAALRRGGFHVRATARCSRRSREPRESVVLTIVEGCGASSQREFARFLDIAIKSSSEVEAQLELAKEYGALAEATWRTMTREVVSIRRQLCALRARVLDAVKPETTNPKPETQNLDSGSPTEGSPTFNEPAPH